MLHFEGRPEPPMAGARGLRKAVARRQRGFSAAFILFPSFGCHCTDFFLILSVLLTLGSVLREISGTSIDWLFVSQRRVPGFITVAWAQGDMTVRAHSSNVSFCARGHSQRRAKWGK